MEKSKDQFLNQQEQEASAGNSGLQLELSQFINFSKLQIQDLKQEVMVKIKDGYTDPLNLLILCKKAQSLFEDIEKEVRPYAANDTNLAGGEKYTKFNTQISHSSNGKYDFSDCGDVVWNDLNKQMLAVKVKLTERETFLKTVTKKMIVGDSETSEGWEINPPVKASNLSLVLKVL